MGPGSKVIRGSGSWFQFQAVNYFAFGWTNEEWAFIVEAQDQSDAEQIIFATGMAGALADE